MGGLTSLVGGFVTLAAAGPAVMDEIEVLKRGSADTGRQLAKDIRELANQYIYAARKLYN